MNYRFPIQNQTLNLKASTNGREVRVERAWDTGLLVECLGISNRRVKRALVLLHTGRVAGRKHLDHSEGERLSHNEKMLLKITGWTIRRAYVNASFETFESSRNGRSSAKLSHL